jgi:hypothetical protein
MTSSHLLLFGPSGAGKTSLLATAEKVSGPFSGEVTELDCDGPLPAFDDGADAIVIVIDVSFANHQLMDQFRQFAGWLKELHELRGRRTDIAELPVFFVLSKCDLLAKTDDTSGAWIKRIEEIKSKFDVNFRKYLKTDKAGFGTLDLKLSATAIKRPAFTDKAANAEEPFGVAELFRECSQSASDFRERRHAAQGRLQNVVVGLIGLVVLLVLSVALLAEFQPPPRGTSLDEKVQAALPKREATALERLQGTSKKLKDRESKLAEIESDTGFGSLPSETRKAVSDYREELAAYLQLEQEAQTLLKQPHLAKNDAELKELEKNVQMVVLPEAHAKDWADTRLGKRLRHVRTEYESLHAAIKDEDVWVQGQIDENRKLMKSGTLLYLNLQNSEKGAEQEAKDWQQKQKSQLNRRPPMPRDDGVPNVAQIVYEDLSKFEPLKARNKEWRKSKDDLTNIADLIQKKLID